MKGLDEIKMANEKEMEKYRQAACKKRDDLAVQVVRVIDEYTRQRVTIGDLLVRLDKLIADLEKTL